MFLLHDLAPCSLSISSVVIQLADILTCVFACSKGAQAGIQTWGCSSKDKASLPTELMGSFSIVEKSGCTNFSYAIGDRNALACLHVFKQMTIILCGI